MAKELKLQDPGEGIHEVEIREVLVSEGDEVNEGDPVLVVESDKAAIDIPAPYSGKIARIAVAEGDTASVGDVLMTFGEAGKAAESEDEAEEEKPEEDDKEEDEKEEAKAEADEGKEEGPEEGEKPEEEEEPASDEEEEPEEEEEFGEEAAERPAADEEAGEVVPASPVARRVAEEHDVDLKKVEPTGDDGRVLREDVEQAAGGGERRPKRAEKQPAGKQRGEKRPAPDFAEWGPVERQQLRSIRRATARRMARAWAEIPHVTHQDVADVTELEDFRRRHAAEVEKQGGKLTLTAFAMKAAVAALKEQPRFNSSLDPETDEIIVKHYHHLGVAVDTDQGLLVPVIRDVDTKSLVELAVELTEVAELARAGKLDRRAMQGGSFTITNVGALGGTGFAPIVNHPEVAILGLARASWQPVIQGDPRLGAEGEVWSLEPRLLLPLCLSFDHRAVDGAAAARFTRRIAATLTDVETFTLVG